MLKANLRSRRVELHMTQEEVARRAGIKRQLYSMYEYGAVPPADRLPALARALRTTPNQLLRGIASQENMTDDGGTPDV